VNPLISQIRKKVFLARDGANVDSLRQRGINYKMVYGVPIITLRKIAANYFPDKEIADILWKEDNRELKIISTLTQDPDSFEDANQWVDEINNLELAEQATMNLFCKLPDAIRLAKNWVQSDKLYVKNCGFLLYTRLFSQNIPINGEDTVIYFDSVNEALNSESLLLQNTALTSLKRLGRQSVLHAKEILSQFSTNPFYDDLKFEFDFFFQI
jgi:hypothetical protein